MEKIKFIREIKKSVSSLVWYLVIDGILLIALGILVLLYEEIVQILFAVFFVLVGITSIWTGVKIYRAFRKIDSFFDFFRKE